MFRKFQKFESFPKSEVFKLKLTEIRNFVPNCIYEFHNTLLSFPEETDQSFKSWSHGTV